MALSIPRGASDILFQQQTVGILMLRPKYLVNVFTCRLHARHSLAKYHRNNPISSHFTRNVSLFTILQVCHNQKKLVLGKKTSNFQSLIHLKGQNSTHGQTCYVHLQI